MSAKIRFKHREPPDGWTNTPDGIVTWLRDPIEMARFLAKEVLHVAANLSIADAPDEEDVVALIHKSNIVLDHLGDVSVMLDKIDSNPRD